MAVNSYIFIGGKSPSSTTCRHCRNVYVGTGACPKCNKSQ